MAIELRTFIEKQLPLEEETWNALEQIVQVKSLARKAHFLHQGDHCKHLGFLVKGYVRLYYLVDGVEITKDFNFENSFCGSYASFRLQQPARFSVVAMEEVKLYLLARDPLFALFDQYPSLQKLGRLSIEQMFIKKELREASFLLDSAEKRYQDLLVQQPEIIRRVPLKYLASYLGLTPETVSRIRNKP